MPPSFSNCSQQQIRAAKNSPPPSNRAWASTWISWHEDRRCRLYTGLLLQAIQKHRPASAAQHEGHESRGGGEREQRLLKYGSQNIRDQIDGILRTVRTRGPASPETCSGYGQSIGRKR